MNLPFTLRAFVINVSTPRPYLEFLDMWEDLQWENEAVRITWREELARIREWITGLSAPLDQVWIHAEYGNQGWRCVGETETITAAQMLDKFKQSEELIAQKGS